MTVIPLAVQPISGPMGMGIGGHTWGMDMGIILAYMGHGHGYHWHTRGMGMVLGMDTTL